MRISEMTNDQATDVLVRIANPIARIMDDEDVESLLFQVSKSSTQSTIKIISNVLPRFVTLALQKHKSDLYEIIGAFSGKTIANVGKMNLMETLNIMKESIDKDFLDFFKLSAGQEQKTAGE